MKSSVFLLLMTVLAISCQSQTTYYVSPSGNDANSGLSSSQAWQSIAKVNSTTFQSSDKVMFEGGKTFVGSLSLQAGKTASLYASYGSGRAIISSGNDNGLYAYNVSGNIEIRRIKMIGGGVGSYSNNGIFFYMDKGATIPNIKIDSCDLSAYSDNGIQFGAYNSAGYGFDNVNILNNNVHDNGRAGISSYGYNDVYSSTNWNIVYDTASYNLGRLDVSTIHTGSGIVIAGVNGVMIDHCIAFENGANNSHIGGGPVGIWFWDTKNGTIQNSESYSNHTGKDADGGGFDIDGGSQNCVLQYNYSHDNDGAGYALFEYGSSNLFNNNIIAYNVSKNDGLKNRVGALGFWANAASNKIANSQVFNNVFYVSNTNVGAAIYVQNTNMNNVRVYNNIFYTTTQVPIMKGDASTITWQNNDYFTLNATANFTTGGISVNPLFVNTQGGPEGFMVYQTSPMIDAGINNGRTKDYFGRTVPQASGYDIGVYEVGAVVSLIIKNITLIP